MAGKLLLGTVICSLYVTVRCSYSASDDVVVLTPSNFNKEVVYSDSLWLVEFYAPWCGHCRSLTPEWKKAATALKGIVKVGAVDADEHKTLGGQYQIRGFPTIKIFGLNKNKPDDYQGARTADAIVDVAINALRSLVKDRLGGRGGGSDYERQRILQQQRLQQQKLQQQKLQQHPYQQGIRQQKPSKQCFGQQPQKDGYNQQYKPYQTRGQRASTKQYQQKDPNPQYQAQQDFLYQ